MFLGAANGDEVEVSQHDYNNVIVSFWKDRTLCIGALIRSDWVLVTHECHNILLRFPEFIILFGGFAMEGFFPAVNIASVAVIHTQSKFLILIVSSST